MTPTRYDALFALSSGVTSLRGEFSGSVKPTGALRTQLGCSNPMGSGLIRALLTP